MSKSETTNVCPPLPPRRTQSSSSSSTIVESDAQLLQVVPPPPSVPHWYSHSATVMSSEPQRQRVNSTAPLNQMYNYNSGLAFNNYVYNSSSVQKGFVSTPLMMAFSNATYTSSPATTLEDIQRTHPIVTNSSANRWSKNNDLIDLMADQDKDVLQLFDPLLMAEEEEEEEDESEEDQVDQLRELVQQQEQEAIKTNSPLIDSKEEKPLRVVMKRSRAAQELEDFCVELRRVRSLYPYNDYNNTNVGLVISPTLDSQHDKSLSVKLVIECNPLSQQSVSFTCNVDTSVEHIISHVICTLVEDASQVQMDQYMLKVFGLSEYFAADSVLAQYYYVHHCHKMDIDVHLCLIHVNDLCRAFARTADDDLSCESICGEDLIPKSILYGFGLNIQTINILLENFDKEIEKLRSESARGRNSNQSGHGLQSQSIIQTVKAICTHLSSLETISLSDSCINFSQLCKQFCSIYGSNGCNSDGSAVLDSRIASIPDLDSKLWEILDHALLKLRTNLIQLIRLYANTFPVEFQVMPEVEAEPEKKSTKVISASMDTLLLHSGVCSQLSPEWLSLYKEFKLRFQLTHGNRVLNTSFSKKTTVSKAFFHRLVFDEWLAFDWPIFNLPREVRLEVTLMGCVSSSDTSSSPQTSEHVELGFGFMYLFDYKQVFSCGQYLIPLWTNTCLDSKLINSQCFEKTAPMVHLIFPETDFHLKFPAVLWDQMATQEATGGSAKKMDSLDSVTQTELFQLLKRNPLEPMSCGDREQLWDRRHYLYDCSEALPEVLLSAHSWEWSSLAEIYSMVHQWSQLSPVEALQLLLPSFADIHIRQISVNWLKKLSPDELCDFLPQLVQSLRFDPYLDSSLIWLLLETALCSTRVCHHLYWILKSNINDPQFSYRARIYLNSLLAICGQSTSQMIDRQEALCGHISGICDHVKRAKESQRLSTLLMELETVHHFLEQNKTTALPLSPSMTVSGLYVKDCSYFPSNSLPLKLVFKNADEGNGLSLDAIFKVGDDLRQDMLSLQSIQIMDKIWLKAGLDLRMITFGCIATDPCKGMLEMVGDSETLRQIQSQHGLTGSFKDRPIAEWLQKHNTSELEYRNAVQNFLYSCAGYSVATYVLGICDRHNDNIMLTTSGHLFHIDFGKFLGDSQMMAGIKRDRVAFVLTQDMAYVINGGDKPSKQFQFFVDLCCQAFNLLRKNGSTLLSLFSLMMWSRITGLDGGDALKYIHRALMPGLSETEAMSSFTRMIEESLRSRFTSFNFFIHNLSQLRFTGDHNDQLLLSFVPKKFTQQSDGIISHVEIVDCFKKYIEDKEKVYFFVIRVERVQSRDCPQFVHRTYREFSEFHEKLNALYPLAKFSRLVSGSASTTTIRFKSLNTREIANQRMQELNNFLKELMLLAHEISHSDIVYTFFHPLLRDQQDYSGTIQRTAISPATGTGMRRESLYGPTISGQIKLSIVYKNMSLVVMIMHAKNLQSTRGGSTSTSSSFTCDSYVKTYLFPDPNKSTKRKTRVVHKSNHPTFMQMIVYQGIPFERVQQKTLHVSVWHYSNVSENLFLGAARVLLKDLELRTESCDWFPLTAN